MRRTLTLLGLAAAALGPLTMAPAAHAQIISAYLTYSPTHFSNVQTGSVYTPTGATYVNQYTSFTTSGVGGGVTFGVLPIGPVRVGLDLRGSTRPGTKGSDTALVGVKVALKLPLLRFKPYVQASGGYVATRTNNVSTLASGAQASPNGTFTNQYVAYEVLGGVDYHLIPFIDLRLLEVGGGQGYNTGVTLANTNNSSRVTLFTINTGVVAHF